MDSKKDLDIRSISIPYSVNNDSTMINSSIESLFNSNSSHSPEMAKMNIYRTEFYNIFLDPKTKWLIDHFHIRLYIKEEFEESKYSHYIPIGYITDTIYTNPDDPKYKDNIHQGIIKANIYNDIAVKFKKFYTKSGDINYDLYKVGYVSYESNIIAITLKHTGKFDTADEFHIYCNKLIRFARDYITDNKLV